LWLSIGILVIIVGAMAPLLAVPLLAVPLNEVRRAAGLPNAADRKAGIVPAIGRRHA